MSKNKLKLFIIIAITILILILILISTYYLYKSYNMHKYHKYDEIISFSNGVNFEVAFYNINNNYVGVVYYTLYPSTNKVKENIYYRDYKESKKISFEDFKLILEKISNKTNNKYTLYENNTLRYGGEKVIVDSDILNNILDIINGITK